MARVIIAIIIVATIAFIGGALCVSAISEETDLYNDIMRDEEDE